MLQGSIHGWWMAGFMLSLQIVIREHVLVQEDWGCVKLNANKFGWGELRLVMN